MILSIEGLEATGKTTLAYSSPLPIVGFAIDFGAERALFGGQYTELFEGLKIEMVKYTGKPQPRPDGADITIYEIPQPVQIDSVRIKGVSEVWNYFVATLVEAFQDNRVETVVVDTMTLARRLKADAYLQGLQDNVKPGNPMRERLLQIEYGAVNDPIRNIYTTGAGFRKNLIAVHHLTDERGEVMDKDGRMQQVLTGRKILEGLGNTHNFVDVAVRMEKDKGKLTCKIGKCGYSLSLEGQVMENPTWDKLVNFISMSTGERIAFGHRVKEGA